MTCFGDYSRYYNLIYRDKEYAAEARYVHELIQQHRPGAASLLNLGCGTGSHDIEFARLGYRVTGVDLSPEMLAAAESRRSGCDLDLSFREGDVRSVRLGTTFDAVLALFHVMSYQTGNDDLLAALVTAREHLEPGGVLLFDCWYGPAVLSDPPVVRVKRLEDEEIELLRIAEPVMHYNRNVVDVNYQVLITEKKSGAKKELRETHRMRYLFMPEVEALARQAGLEPLFAYEWLTRSEPGNRSWGTLFAFRK